MDLLGPPVGFLGLPVDFGALLVYIVLAYLCNLPVDFIFLPLDYFEKIRAVTEAMGKFQGRRF